MNGKSIQQLIDPAITHETIFFREPKHLDFVREHDLPAQSKSTSPKIVQTFARSAPDKAVKRGKWSLYFLCKHCDTEWLCRSDTTEAISRCPVCSTLSAPYEYE